MAVFMNGFSQRHGEHVSTRLTGGFVARLPLTSWVTSAHRCIKWGSSYLLEPGLLLVVLGASLLSISLSTTYCSEHFTQLPHLILSRVSPFFF